MVIGRAEERGFAEFNSKEVHGGGKGGVIDTYL